MSGAWAREADARIVHLLLPEAGLARAARHLAFFLETDDHWLRSEAAILASAIIRRERKRLDPEGYVSRRSDWPDTFGDEALIWTALRMVATVDVGARDLGKARHLRHAEAALRTLHKRGRS